MGSRWNAATSLVITRIARDAAAAASCGGCPQFDLPPRRRVCAQLPPRVPFGHRVLRSSSILALRRVVQSKLNDGGETIILKFFISKRVKTWIDYRIIGSCSAQDQFPKTGLIIYR